MMLIYCCESQMSEREKHQRPQRALAYFCYIHLWNLYCLAERAEQMILEFKSLTVMWKGQGYRSCPIWIPPTEVSLCISEVYHPAHSIRKVMHTSGFLGHGNMELLRGVYSVALVRERTIPTERPPPFGEVSANFLRIEGCHVVSATDPHGR